YLPTLASTTRTEHARMLNLIAQDFKDFAVDEVEAPDVLRFLENHYDADAEKGTTERRRMKHHARARLSTFVAWCVQSGRRKVNPCREVWLKKPKAHKSKWTGESFHAVREHLTPMLQCYLDLSYLLYQRATDARLLKWSQVHERQNYIHFEPTKTV